MTRHVNAVYLESLANLRDLVQGEVVATQYGYAVFNQREPKTKRFSLFGRQEGQRDGRPIVETI